jgi:hypothetical protein
MRISVFVIFLGGISAGFLLRSPKLQSMVSSLEDDSQADVEKRKLDQWRKDGALKAFCQRAKSRLYAEVINHKLPLLQAATYFRAIDDLDPTFNEQLFKNSFAGRSMEERYCREVVAWANTSEELNQDAESREARRRMEQELTDLLDRTKAPPTNSLRSRNAGHQPAATGGVAP